jgi:hypothetical protein
MDYEVIMAFVVRWSRVADFLADVGFVVAVYVICPIFLWRVLRLFKKIEINTRG